MAEIKGIIPALLTPYNMRGAINEYALEQLVDFNLKKGVSGFYVCGSTGEAFLLSIEERKRILEVVAGKAKGKCAVIAHIGCISSDQAIELAKHAEKLGVDAVSSIPPFYYNFSFEEIRSYYLDLANSVEVPVIIYNFPGFSGVNFSDSNLHELLSNKSITGIKHTSYDLYQLERIKKFNKKITVFNGRDEIFLAGLAMGADGAIGSTFNFMAEKFIKINELFNNREMELARSEQEEANEIIKALEKVGVLPGEKEIMKILGIDCGTCRKPFRQLSAEEIKLLETVICKYIKS